jgi:hypothetical protein
MKRLFLGVALASLLVASGASAATKHKAATAAEPPVAIPATGVLTEKELGYVANQVRKASAASDAFSAAPGDPALIGRQFRVATPFMELTNEGGPRMARNGGWKYLVDDGKLRLDMWPNQFHVKLYGMANDLRVVGHGFTVVTHVDSLPYKGQNAFGQTATVNMFGLDAFAMIQIQATPTDAAFPSYLPFDINHPGLNDPVVDVPMSPDEAKTVTKSLVLAVYGTIQASGGKRFVGCGSEATAPATIDNPHEVVEQVCLFSAHIDRYAIEDRTTGKVLAEWKNDGAQQASTQ